MDRAYCPKACPALDGGLPTLETIIETITSALPEAKTLVTFLFRCHVSQIRQPILETTAPSYQHRREGVPDLTISGFAVSIPQCVLYIYSQT